MWFTLYEFALFTAICCRVAHRSFKPISTVFNTLHKPILSFQVGESCKCAVSLPTPIPLRPPFQKQKDALGTCVFPLTFSLAS